MPTKEPPGIPIARRTRSRLPLGTASTNDSIPQQEATMVIPPVPPPIEQREDLFPSFDRPMATILPMLCEALKNSTIQTWSRFLRLRNFDDLTYRDQNEYKQLPRYLHQELHLFVTFSSQLKDQGKDPKDHSLYTKESFESYSDSVLASVQHSTVNRLSYQNETTFPVLNIDARFEHWLVKFKAKLASTDINTTTFLDPDWSPHDLSSSCVLSHTSTNDGRQAYFDFSKVYDTSIAMQDLLSMDLLSWKDTKVKFITTWFANPLEYDSVRTHLCKACNSNYQLNEQFTKIEDPMEAHDLQAFRRNEAKATSELKTTLLLEATRLDSQATWSQPSGCPSVKAHAHDFESTEQTYSMVTDNTGYYSLPLDFHGDFQDYAPVYRAGRAPDPSTRLPTPVWQTLSKPGMKTWLTLLADDKKKLVACLQPELLPEQSPNPNSAKPISQPAYEHSIAPDPATAPSTITEPSQLTPDAEADARNAFHVSLGVYKASSEADNLPLKSSVSPAHYARFLVDNPSVLYKKDATTYIPVGSASLSAKSHHWFVPESCVSQEPTTTVYHSNKTNVSTPGYAMVDHGANGCIIDNDACLISKDIPPRYVNVTGINNHQIQNIPIATCGAYSVSNRGPVILIFHECAYTGQFPSILLSSGQMEAYLSLVDDTSIKAGGTQVITTTDGHVFPLSICHHGLPYLAMRKYTSEEFSQLPHVIMTSTFRGPFETQYLSLTHWMANPT
eukprot:jgi/Psemu1/27670/gm1.27670_g